MVNLKNLKKKIWNTPKSLSFDDWEKWERKKKKDYPVRWFFFEAIPDKIYSFNSFIKKWHWWVRYRTFDKYHVVDTKLSPQYYDVDTLMIHSCFSLLERFVDEEKGLETINWDWNLEHRMVEKEIIFLLNWWRGRKERERIWEVNNPEPSIGEDDFSWTSRGKPKEWKEWARKYLEQEETWKSEDTEMFIRLIKIRNYLWT